MRIQEVNKELVWKLVQKYSSTHVGFFKVHNTEIPDLSRVEKVYFNFEWITMITTAALHINNGEIFSVRLVPLMRRLNTYFNCGYDVEYYRVEVGTLQQFVEDLNSVFQCGIDKVSIIDYYDQNEY